MYNSTNNPRNVSNILNSKGSHLFLGDGLYVSRDIEKNGQIRPCLLQAIGVSGQDAGGGEMEELMRQAWQAEYSLAGVSQTAS